MLLRSWKSWRWAGQVLTGLGPRHWVPLRLQVWPFPLGSCPWVRGLWGMRQDGQRNAAAASSRRLLEAVTFSLLSYGLELNMTSSCRWLSPSLHSGARGAGAREGLEPGPCPAVCAAERQTTAAVTADDPRGQAPRDADQASGPGALRLHLRSMGRKHSSERERKWYRRTQ